MTDGWQSGEQRTILELLDRRIEHDPDSQYLDVCGAQFSAADVHRTANQIANGLSGLGCGPGDRVAMLIENSPEAMLSWWGAVQGGTIAVPINTAYKGTYLRHQLGDSGARAVIVQRTLADRVDAILHELPDLEHVIVVDEYEAPGEGHTIANAENVHEWADVFNGDDTRPKVAVAPSDLATFIYTGGTTGPSKGCMLSHNYHVSMSQQIGYCWQRTPDDIVWTPLPLFHFNALVTAVLGALLFGGSSAIYRRFSVSNFWPEINRTRATVTSTLGTMAYLLVNDEDRPEMPQSGAPEANTTLRLLGAAPLAEEIDIKIRERFGIETFSGGFGLTEAGLLSWQPPGKRNKPNAAGMLNTVWFDVRLFDDDDNEVPQGERGEIVARPKHPHIMFEGYWGNPEATVRATKNLWLHTGDIARVDEDGYLFFVDRKADYLRRRGENISSFEVESIIMSHGAVADCVVHAVPSEMAEDDLKITATLKADATVTEEELFRWCIDQLPYFALPRYVEFRAELPRSPVGRVLKRTLRDDGVTPTTWDAEAAGVKYDKR
jgi:crotonobetaine/carnitine-CoA ligase